MSLFTAVNFVNSLFTSRSASFIFCQVRVKKMSHHAKERETRQNSEIGRERGCRHPVRGTRIGGKKSGKPLPLGYRDELSYTVLSDVRFYFFSTDPCTQKRRCEITIISFSRSICRGGLAALIGVTGKPYPSCLSYHSHPIRPCGAPSPRGEGCDTRILSSKKKAANPPREP